jgi:hypothetical protein
VRRTQARFCGSRGRVTAPGYPTEPRSGALDGRGAEATTAEPAGQTLRCRPDRARAPSARPCRDRCSQAQGARSNAGPWLALRWVALMAHPGPRPSPAAPCFRLSAVRRLPKSRHAGSGTVSEIAKRGRGGGGWQARPNSLRCSRRHRARSRVAPLPAASAGATCEVPHAAVQMFNTARGIASVACEGDQLRHGEFVTDWSSC